MKAAVHWTGSSRFDIYFVKPGRVVRLVGLSGVGKTRFVQALFDNRIGERSLESSWAVYANLPTIRKPQPQASHPI